MLDGGLAERVFFIVSIVFMVLYACGILFMWRPKSRSRRTAFHGRTAITALFLAVTISAVAGGLGLFNSSSSGAVSSPASISIIELQSAVDMKTLPVQKMNDATFVFDHE